MIDSSDDEIEGDPCGFVGGESLPLSPSSLESPFDILTPCLPMSDLDHRTYVRADTYTDTALAYAHVHMHTDVYTHTHTHIHDKGTNRSP